MAQRSPLHETLVGAGASFTEVGGWEVVDDFGDSDLEYQAARSQSVVFDHSGRGKMEVAGPEADFFLQNIATNDIKSLAANHGCETFLTTHKARIIAHGFISHWRDKDGDNVYLFDTAVGLDDTVAKHLDHHWISEQLILENCTTSVALLHICGPQALATLEKATGASPAGLEPLCHLDVTVMDSTALRIRRNDHLALPGFDVFLPADQADAVWNIFTGAGAIPAGRRAHEILRVEAGFPQHGNELDESRLAMEVGRTPQAVSYQKGCYLGQETIVMARDRGHVNRTLLGLKVMGQNPITPGTKVLHDGKEVGHVSSSVHSPRLGSIALAFLVRGCQTPGTSVNVDEGGTQREAVITALPFAIDAVS